MTNQSPAWDDLWDYNNPAAIEQRFRILLTQLPNDNSERLELLTQLARALGLQQKFAEAHHLLDTVEAQLPTEPEVLHLRYLLERGRLFNSAGQQQQARPLFVRAWEQAQAFNEAFYAVDAAHMLGIVEPPTEQLAWNLRAMELARSSDNPRAQRWIGSLLNNIGWSYHDQGQYEQALATFQQALEWREQQGNPRETRITRWCVARTLRSLGCLEEALAMQQALLAEWQRSGDQDGYVYEELAECLYALDQPDDAKPYFKLAYEALSSDAWLVGSEGPRLERLRALAETP